MTLVKLNLCYRCAASLRMINLPILYPSNFRLRRQTRFFSSTRTISLKKPVLKIAPPDPSSPLASVQHPIQGDPGVSLSSNGIPVPPSPSQSNKTEEAYEEEKSWAETVLRTLSGGMKSDYLRCTFHHTCTGD